RSGACGDRAPYDPCPTDTRPPDTRPWCALRGGADGLASSVSGPRPGAVRMALPVALALWRSVPPLGGGRTRPPNPPRRGAATLRRDRAVCALFPTTPRARSAGTPGRGRGPPGPLAGA